MPKVPNMIQEFRIHRLQTELEFDQARYIFPPYENLRL